MNNDKHDSLAFECEHGTGVAAVVCTHLVGQPSRTIGFIENSNIQGDYQAWCKDCEQRFIECGEELNDAFRKFNDFKLVCEQCYGGIKKHQLGL